MTTIEDAINGAALKFDVPLILAEAVAWHESGLDPKAVGDEGTSFGLYQLHEGGELGTLTEDEAFVPFTNASVALSEFADVKRNNPDIVKDWGTWAATAQRPADPSAYAAAVNAIVAQINNGSIPEGFRVALVALDPTAAPVPSPSSQTPEPPSPVEATYVTPTLPELKEGQSGYPVRILQIILGGNLTVDGIFGPDTAASLRSFQVSKGLAVTSVTDIQTWENLIGRQVS
jgi:peptidoglycan hydrolase-like protein with peptidoglycan-binding domain